MNKRSLKQAPVIRERCARVLLEDCQPEQACLEIYPHGIFVEKLWENGASPPKGEFRWPEALYFLRRSFGGEAATQSTLRRYQPTRIPEY